MKVAILSDVHGNLRALENVLNSNIFKTVDKIILLGDLVDYGPHSNEVVELLSEYEPKIICNIIGNHEEAILKQDYSRFSSERGRKSAQFTRKNLNNNTWQYINEKMNHEGKLIASIVAKNLLKFAFCYGIPFVILYREYGLTLLQSWAVTSLAFMLAAVIPSPAGIGSSEFVFTALFTVLVGTGEAGSAALLYRFATFVLPFVIGGVVVLLHKRIDRRIAKRKADKAQQ